MAPKDPLESSYQRGLVALNINLQEDLAPPREEPLQLTGANRQDEGFGHHVRKYPAKALVEGAIRQMILWLVERAEPSLIGNSRSEGQNERRPIRLQVLQQASMRLQRW